MSDPKELNKRKQEFLRLNGIRDNIMGVFDNDNTQVQHKPLVPIKELKKVPQGYIQTANGTLIKIPAQQSIGPAPIKTRFAKEIDKRRGEIQQWKEEEQKKKQEQAEAIEGVIKMSLPSTYIGPLFNNNGKSYTYNLLSGEGTGDWESNLAIDLITPFAASKAVNVGKQLLKPRFIVAQSPKSIKLENMLTNHLQEQDAIDMFKQYGGIEIPEGSINGEQLRRYAQEARIRYGLVGNKNITDEEIAQALYKHSQELGEGSAAKNIQGEPQLLFRGDTKRYTELKPRPTPEELAKVNGTMDNSLGTLFLGQMPESIGGLERYIVGIRDFRGIKKLMGSGTGSRVKLPNGDIVKEYVNDEIAVIPEGSYQLFSSPFRYGNASFYKLPASWSESGVNDINAFVVRTPNMRDATKEISVLNDDFLVKGGPKVDYYGPVVGNELAGSSERNAMAKHYEQVLNKAREKQQGLLKSNKDSYLRDEHSSYDYFALPNFNIRGAKHLLPYDLRIPRNWNDPNIYKALIPIGGTTYGIDIQNKEK